MLETASLDELRRALRTLEQAFGDLAEFEPAVDVDAIGEVLQRVAERMHDNYPYPHPFYAGQMLKPPHPVARLAYMLSMWINPNNHALDGGRASSAMEIEAVENIARMFGYEAPWLGHLTSSGTIANLEALWVGGERSGGKLTVASEESHYTHERLCGVLKLPYAAVPSDDRARMDVAALAALLEQEDVGTVVATLGTTGMGAVDPLHEILALREQHGFRLHVDAAYGGYFTLLDDLGANARAAFDRIGEADSIVVDPHKHGLQPYGCGCVLFKDPAVGKIYRHGSPYTYFTSDALHLGEISLECSRAGAAAVALWATQQLMPMTRDGAFAADLRRCRESARRFAAAVRDDPQERLLLEPELDIVVWAPRASRASETSELAQAAFDAAAAHGLHLATMTVRAGLAAECWPDLEMDAETVTCLRSVMMKPEHEAWCERLFASYKQARGGLTAASPS